MYNFDIVIEPARLAAIHSVVDRIHSQLRFNAPAFPFEEFLHQNPSYRVTETDLPSGLDGKLTIAPTGERIIQLRRQNPRPRLRFTLAHEIMHAELHLQEGRLCNNQACRTTDRFKEITRTIAEREADLGAAALLIPMWMLDRYLAPLRRQDVGDVQVQQLAKLFRVSERTMKIQVELYDRAYRGEMPSGELRGQGAEELRAVAI